MANTQVQFGFQHIGYLPGYAPDYQPQTFPILRTFSGVIGFGDPVGKLNATSPYIGYATTAAGGNATTPIMGVFAGCQYTPSGGLGIPVWSPGWPGNTVAADATAYVISSPGALFKVAALNTAISSANVGEVVGFTSAVAATTVGGMFSGATIDQSTVTASAVGTYSGTTFSMLPFKIISLYQGVGNGSDPTTAYNWAVVGFNNQLWRMPY